MRIAEVKNSREQRIAAHSHIKVTTPTMQTIEISPRVDSKTKSASIAVISS